MREGAIFFGESGIRYDEFWRVGPAKGNSQVYLMYTSDVCV
jgi:hypothetical protein